MKSRKGAILLQTTVTCILVAIIGVMILKWALLRYFLAGKAYQNVGARARAEGYLMNRVSYWNYQVAPSAASELFDNQYTVSVRLTPPPANEITVEHNP